MSTGLLLVAHGSAGGGSQQVVRELARQVSMLVAGLEVQAAFLDHDETTPDLGLALLAARGCTRAVVVPVLLSGAFHVFEDLPQRLGERLPSVITTHLGPDDRVVTAIASTLSASNVAGADSILLVATGSSDPRLQAEVATAAEKLAERLDTPTTVGYLSAAEPDLATAVARARANGRNPVVAAYLLAEGRFSGMLHEQCEALAIQHGPVIGAHPQLAILIAERLRAALT